MKGIKHTKPDEARKTTRMNVRCTPEDFELVSCAAVAEGRSISDYVLNALADRVYGPTYQLVLSGKTYAFPSRRPALLKFLTILDKTEVRAERSKNDETVHQ